MNKRVIELSEHQKHLEKYKNGKTELRFHDVDYKLLQQIREKNTFVIKELKNEIEIESNSHIGSAKFIEFGINIKPKFALKQENLPKLIQYAFDLDDIKIMDNEIEILAKDPHLIDVIINLFVYKCKQLLRQGLLKSYVTYQDDVKFLRGKIILKQQQIHIMRKNLLFACEYDELEYNNLENQIILNCLKSCYSITDSDFLTKQIRILVHQFEESVDHVKINSRDFKKINYTHLNHHYKPLHELAYLLIFEIGIYDSYLHDGKNISSFFVDMSRIFEKFITKLFQEHTNYKVESQKNKQALISNNDQNYNIRPDILLTNKNGKKLIVDIKYKRKPNINDIYQIGFYIHEHKERKGFVILPASNGYESNMHEYSENYHMESPIQKIRIHIKTINIDQTLDLIYENTKESNEKLCKRINGLVQTDDDVIQLQQAT